MKQLGQWKDDVTQCAGPHIRDTWMSRWAYIELELKEKSVLIFLCDS